MSSACFCRLMWDMITCTVPKALESSSITQQQSINQIQPHLKLSTASHPLGFKTKSASYWTVYFWIQFYSLVIRKLFFRFTKVDMEHWFGFPCFKAVNCLIFRCWIGLFIHYLKYSCWALISHSSRSLLLLAHHHSTYQFATTNW